MSRFSKRLGSLVRGIRPPTGAFTCPGGILRSVAVVAFSATLALAIVSTTAIAQPITPSYDPPVIATPLHPHAGGANMILCVVWLEGHRDRLNDAAGPGGNDPIVRISGPTATTGNFGTDNLACKLKLTHVDHVQETGWLGISTVATIWTTESSAR